jgi:hypothetical protein
MLMSGNRGPSFARYYSAIAAAAALEAATADQAKQERDAAELREAESQGKDAGLDPKHRRDVA